MSYTDQDFEQTAASHTPGPWSYRGRDGNGARPVVSSESANMIVATLSYGPEGEANARLIAAAPDLLAELAALVHDIEVGITVTDGMLADARAAIAKATQP